MDQILIFHSYVILLKFKYDIDSYIFVYFCSKTPLYFSHGLLSNITVSYHSAKQLLQL